MLVNFDSLADFARLASSHISFVTERGWDRLGFDYTGGDFNQSINKAINGDDSLVPQAEALIAKLDVDLPEIKAFKRLPSPYGSRVCMSDWIAGAPKPMRKRTRVISEIDPIKIVVGVSCSAGIRANLMEQRGVTILALVLKIQQIRPVNLYLLTEDSNASEGWHYHMIQIESNPLHLGSACFGLCSASIERQLSYTILHSVYGVSPRWPDNYESLAYWELKRQRLGLTENDVLIKPAHLLDPLIDKPMEWIKDQLTKIVGSQD